MFRFDEGDGDGAHAHDFVHLHAGEFPELHAINEWVDRHIVKRPCVPCVAPEVGEDRQERLQTRHNKNALTTIPRGASSNNRVR